ncbi:MAG TPA: hypothetical protein VE931_07960 [Pyrinomonadaceae bacterium]|nr:hypothetical protein [Pyrinomonadaceae bacterium]
MNKLRRTGAIVTLSLTLAVSTFAGTIHSTGAVKPPEEDPPKAQTTSTTSISTTLILTILGLIR